MRLSGYLKLVNITLRRSHSDLKDFRVDDRWNARFNMVFSSDFLYFFIDMALVVKQYAGVRRFPINTNFQFAAFLEHFHTDKW